MSGNPLKGLFNRGSTASPTFTDQAQGQVIDPLTGKLSDYFKTWNPNDMSQSFDTGVNSNSLFQGAQGYMGQAGNLFNLGQNTLGGPDNGANNWLTQILNPNFTNMNNPEVQSVLDAMTGQAQRGFNFGADKIASSAASTSGGLGKSTATTDSLSRLNADAQNQLSGTTANFLQSELARRQGLQSGAATTSLADIINRAQTYGQLGTGLGNLGTQQANFGQYVQGQNQMGANAPLEEFFRLAGLLKSGNNVTQPSLWDMISQGAQAVGNTATAASQATSGRTTPMG